MGKFIDLTGMQFGSWYVIEYIGKGKYKCQCSCSAQTVKILNGFDLKNGKVTRCQECRKKYNVNIGDTFNGWVVTAKLPKGLYELTAPNGEKIKKSPTELFNTKIKDVGSNNNKFKDLTGQKFGNLTAIEYIGNRMWKCECSCGSPNCLKVKNIHGYSLTRGATKSCGASTTGFKDLSGEEFGAWKVIRYANKSKMWVCKCSCGIEKVVHINNLRNAPDYCTHQSKLIDITGQRFGKLVVIKYIGDYKWLCKCDCGNTIEVYGANLRRDDRGTRSCGCSKEELRQNTMIEKYGDIAVGKINKPRESWQIDMLKNKDGLVKAIELLSSKNKRKPTIKDLSDLLDSDPKRMSERITKYSLLDLMDTSHGKSQAELQLLDFIRNECSNYGYIVESGNRDILNGKELDIYIPNLKLAIEYNGSFWHDADVKGINYHYNKSHDAAVSGVRLIHIFDYEYMVSDGKNNIEKYLKNILNGHKRVINGRDCTVGEISKSEAEEFLNNNHLQLWVPSSIYIGLKFNNELIEVMSFGKPRFNNEYEIEMYRLATKYGTIVNGGTEKLFKHFINRYNPKSIISYCDISKFTGAVYTRLGFKNIGISAPNYRWVNPSNMDVISRYKAQKSKLVKQGLGLENQTEDEIMRSMGYNKVYDCGNIRYVWTNMNIQCNKNSEKY